MESIRVVTLNLWGENAPLDRRLAHAAEQLRALDPDVVALQEVRVVPPAVPNTAETLARALKYEVHWAPATPWGGGEEGLAILSRFPISKRSSRELPGATPDERRIVLGAVLDTPAGSFAAFTTHLNYRLGDGAKREAQVAAVAAHIAEIDVALPKVLMGDFNSVAWSDEIRYLRGLHSVAGARVYFQDAFESLHPREDGFTWARRNPYTARLHFLERDRRIDYIFVSPLQRDGRGLVRECRVVLDEATPDGVYCSDHFGLMAEIQLQPISVA
jgi:endonuclease/exonuclease/phosphatase family metal-dependent hydrolase